MSTRTILPAVVLSAVLLAAPPPRVVSGPCRTPAPSR